MHKDKHAIDEMAWFVLSVVAVIILYFVIDWIEK